MTLAIVAGHTTASRASSGTSIAINTPTHAAGDMLYVLYASDGDGDTASLTGFSVYGPITLEGGGGVFYRFTKTASGSEPASYTINNTVSERAVAFAFAVRDDNGINATGTNQAGTGTSATLPAVTSTEDNCLRISILTSNKDATPVSTGSGLTLLGTVGVSSGGTLSVQYKSLGAAGTDAAVTVTITSQAWLGHTIAIAPVAANVLVAPAAAISASSAVVGTLVFGSTTATPTAASAANSAVVGTVILGALAVTPAAASAISDALVEAVLGGGIALSPAVAIVSSSAQEPTLDWGSTAATPTQAEAASTALIGSAIGGGISFRPDEATVTTSASSTVILGSLTITEVASVVASVRVDTPVISGVAIAAVFLTLMERGRSFTVRVRRTLSLGAK